MPADYPGSLHTFTDVVDGVTVVGAAEMNSAHAEIIAVETELMQNKSAFRVYRVTSYQAIATVTLTPIQFNGTTYDILSEWTGADDWDFTPLVSGYYFLTCNLFFPAFVASQYVAISFYVNGTERSKSILWGASSSQLAFNLTDVLYLTAGEPVQVRVIHSRGSDANIMYGIQYCYFAGHKLP